MTPTTSTMNTAGPSPESAAARSSPQASQAGLTFRYPSNSAPSPQAGQRQVSPATTGFTGRPASVNAYSAG
jgi:hypothetical protein